MRAIYCLGSLESQFTPAAAAGTGALEIEDRGHPDVFTWTAHPLREQPGRALLAVAIVLACGLLVATAVGGAMTGPAAGGGAIAFLLLTLNRFFLPSHYRVDRHGIAVRYPVGSRSLRWTELRRFPHDAQGGYVSPRRKGGMLDTRGISLLFAGHGSEIIPRIQAGMEQGPSLSTA